MKIYTQKRQRLERDLGERKAHFKLYKAGKLWLVAGVATVSFGLYASFGSITMAQADTTGTTAAANTTTDTQSKTMTLSNSQTPTTTESDPAGATDGQAAGTESTNEVGAADTSSSAAGTNNSGETTVNAADSSQ